jgi:hypothetical protein
VVIKSSSRQQVEGLLSDLASDQAVAREGAIARLAVIGSRALGQLTALATEAGVRPGTRAAALRTLEAIADPRSLDTAARALEDEAADTCPAVALAAVGVLRAFVRSRHSTPAVESLTRAVVDRRRPDTIRLGALDALGLLERDTLRPLLTLLQDDPSEAVRQAVRTGDAPSIPQNANRTRLGADGDLPADPRAVQRWIARAGDAAPLSSLHKLVGRIREREAATANSEREKWTVVRAAAHLALARRGSRVALYDLRETLESGAGPLPVEFVTVLTTVGDASCLEAIAAAHDKTRRSTDAGWWQRHLASAFQAIVEREGITRRHPVIKKIERRWQHALRELWAETGAAPAKRPVRKATRQ